PRRVGDGLDIEIGEPRPSRDGSEATRAVLGDGLNTDWASHEHVSDEGIVRELLQGLGDDTERRAISQRIQAEFVSRIRGHVQKNELDEIVGANSLLNHLRRRKDVVLALATGGWKSTAELKLTSAGLEFEGIAFASSDDHFDRVEILKAAHRRTGVTSFRSRTFVGDGAWDKAASDALNFSFVLVGSKISSPKQMGNLVDLPRFEVLAGL
ncbi:MAG: hypothetical protein AAGI44_20030, partial [Pseudomonadota bacterium]